MSCLDTIVRAKTYLEQQGCVSLKALRREFALDDDMLAELVDELAGVQHVATRDGLALAWVGATPSHGVEPETSHEAGERRQPTVVFCHLVGSTPPSQQLDLEEVIPAEAGIQGPSVIPAKANPGGGWVVHRRTGLRLPPE